MNMEHLVSLCVEFQGNPFTSFKQMSRCTEILTFNTKDLLTTFRTIDIAVEDYSRVICRDMNQYCAYQDVFDWHSL